MSKSKYKRVLLKLSGEALAEKGERFNFSGITELVNEVKHIKKNVEVAIVVGGGNIWRHRDFEDSGVGRVDSDYIGMMATMINGAVFRNVFQKNGLEAEIFSPFAIPHVVDLYERNRALAALKAGKVVILAGGTGNPFFTTDTAAALRALELNCEIIYKATNVDYVYDKDPTKYKDAKNFTKISYDEVIEKNLRVMDLTAISLCKDGKIPVQVFNFKKKGNIKKVLSGMSLGTIIS
jgi:uridylate kinase